MFDYEKDWVTIKKKKQGRQQIKNTLARLSRMEGLIVRWKPQNPKSDYSKFLINQILQEIWLLFFSLALLECDSYFEFS